VERTSANDLTEVQENASELVRSVGDVAGKFIKEQPITAALIALGIGWLSAERIDRYSICSKACGYRRLAMAARHYVEVRSVSGH
jgi:hypothetical protein